MAQQVVVVGGGFAGVWAALGAARAAREFGAPMAISLVSADPWLTIRPRLYEASFRDARVWLDRFLAPVGVQRVEARVTSIDAAARSLTMAERRGGTATRTWDGLVLAAGSQVVRPPIPGLADHGFTVDTYAEAVALDDALDARCEAGLPAPRVAVVGGGFAGLEVATEMVARVRDRWPAAHPHVALVDRGEVLGAALGEGPRPAIEEAVAELGIEQVMGRSVGSVSSNGVTLDDGTAIPADLVVWTAGLRASPLAEQLGPPVDELGRVTVDRYLRVPGTESVWAAGDVARAATDAEHLALQSCQHAQPQGRVAGHNVVAGLLGRAEVPYEQPDYVTCLDLGPAGAVFTRGWDRTPHATGDRAKAIKRSINWDRIVPPTTGQAEDLLAAAAPTVTPVRG